MVSKGWEQKVLRQAQEGLEDEAFPESLDGYDGLQSAYGACDAIAQENSHTFYLASSRLPAEKRRAVRSLYAFCRITDDLIDRQCSVANLTLASWQACIQDALPCDHPVALAWTDTRARYRIPNRYAEQLIDGVSADLRQQRYETFDELALYCYGVASTVGLMSMHIVGFSGPDAIPYAVKLGIAMQMTNILRDVKEDWEAGRVYLPQAELREYGLSDRDIAAGCNTQRWQSFMRFQVARNLQLYREAMPGLNLLHRSGRFAIAAAAELYLAILCDIERREYDVFGSRAEISTAGKLRRLPGIWWRSRRANAQWGIPDLGRAAGAAAPHPLGSPSSEPQFRRGG